MQSKILVLVLAATAYAQLESLLPSVTDSQVYVSLGTPPCPSTNIIHDSLSIISVLETAIPTSVIQEALTNPNGYANEIESQFNNGERPDWFTALPSDIQGYLIPAEASSYLPSANASVVSTSSRTGVASASMTPSMTDNSTTLATTSRRPSRTTSGGVIEATGDGSQSSETSEGGAQATKVVGMSVAGVVGLVGLWAL
jgi:hypothetical protein